MVSLLTANYIEYIDVLIKTMVVRIGKDKKICIKKDVLDQICNTLRKYRYETGGIIGSDSREVISCFQFDRIAKSCLHEYYPNISFLNNIINRIWSKSDIEFIGFVHSHLNNDDLSPQDIKYAQEILTVNDNMDYILIGVINLNVNNNIKWYIVN